MQRRILWLVLGATLLQSVNASADNEQLARGRRTQTAGAALIIVGSALIVGGAALGIAGLLGSGRAKGSERASDMVWGGLGMGATGTAALGTGVPVYVYGTDEVDRARASIGSGIPSVALRF